MLEIPPFLLVNFLKTLHFQRDNSHLFGKFTIQHALFYNYAS